MNMQELVQQLSEALVVANEDVSRIEYNFRPGFVIRQNQAKQEVLRLTDEFRKRLLSHSVKVFVTGTKNKDVFTKLVESSQSYVTSVNELYVEIAKYLEPLVHYGGNFTSSAFIRLNDTVYGFINRFHLPSMTLVEPINIGVQSFDDLVRIVKETIRKAYGDALNNSYMVNNLLDTALKVKYNKDYTLFVVTDVMPEDRTQLSENIMVGQPSMVVELDEEEGEVTPKFVEALRARAVKSLKKLGKLTDITNN